MGLDGQGAGLQGATCGPGLPGRPDRASVRQPDRLSRRLLHLRPGGVATALGLLQHGCCQRISAGRRHRAHPPFAHASIAAASRHAAFGGTIGKRLDIWHSRCWQELVRPLLVEGAEGLQHLGECFRARTLLFCPDGRCTLVACAHVGDLFIAFDRRCKSTLAVMEALVKEFKMSRKDKCFVFCGRRVQVEPEQILTSQQQAALCLEPLHFAYRRAPPDTALLRGEHTAFRSLLG